MNTENTWTQDKTRQDKTRQDKTRQDKTRQDKTRQDKTRQDKTRQDKTRQDKTRQAVQTVTTELYALVVSSLTLRAYSYNSVKLLHVDGETNYVIVGDCLSYWMDRWVSVLVGQPSTELT